MLLGRADLTDDGGELGDGGQQGAGGDRPAQLFHDDSRFHNGQADAAVLLGDGQGGPVEGDHGAPQLLGGFTGLDDGAHDVDGAFLLEERADRGAQLFLLTRELELHRTPSPASPVASRPSGTPWARQIGASVPDAYVSLIVPASPRRPVAGRTSLLCPGRLPIRGAGPGRRCGCRAANLPNTRGHSPTLSGAPLAQRQSNGLLIRRFRVRIPRGARIRWSRSVSGCTCHFRFAAWTRMDAKSLLRRSIQPETRSANWSAIWRSRLSEVCMQRNAMRSFDQPARVSRT